LNQFYQAIDVTKQGVHQMIGRRKASSEEETYLVELIRQVRKDHPFMCCEQLYYLMRPASMGRDKFIEVCRAHGLMSRPVKNFKRTTDSSGVVRFKNELLGLKLTGINQAWCSDITYFELSGTFYYITFILDCHSRRILGWNVSGRLTTESTSLPALKMAMKTRGNNDFTGCVFHSDGGGQYYDKDFVALTYKKGFVNSMCEYAWENGKAERVNGIIKNNYLRGWKIQTLDDLVESVKRAVGLYNQEKPHNSLNRKTPINFEENLLLFQKEKIQASSKID
jgi:putative transposase